MRVVIIGPGRLGSALAQRSVALGHETRVLCRTPRSSTIRALPRGVAMEPIGTSRPQNVDMVIVAAPAQANEEKEESIASFLRTVDTSVPVCFAIAYASAPLKRLAQRHAFIRFMCSPAVANTRSKPLVVVSGHSRQARERFVQWLGGDVCEVPEKQFLRLSSLFIATAVHCDTLMRIVKLNGRSASKTERRFVARTLLEAFALMETYNFRADLALEACATPNGMTRKIIKRLRTL